MLYQHNLVGNSLGRCELQEMLHAGNIVTSYRGFQPDLQRHVTVQVLAAGLRTEATYRAAFREGARLIASFEHPHIVPILDYGEQAGVDYIVMRQMNGGTLKMRLGNAGWGFKEVATFIRQIGAALDYVHARGETHGDPATINIVFDGAGSAYLADFLLAGFQKQLEGFLGVPLYMAPERWKEEKPTPLSDQYALAVIAYEALTGKPLFEAPALVPLMQKHLDEAPPAPQTLRPDIPNQVTPVLLRALAKTPEERYPTILDFARELENALATPPAHLFISYSRRDGDYAKYLRQHLLDSGLPVWLDDAIEHGEQWFAQIHTAIQNAAAVLVIMSPTAEASEWVHKEILLAKRYQKPIFPLLLSGSEFPLLIDIQYADVRDSALPNAAFHRRIRESVFGKGV